MNRRNFLRMIGLGVAGLYLRVAPNVELPPARVDVYWFQTERLTEYYSEPYLRAIEEILSGRAAPYLRAFQKEPTAS